MKLAISSAAFDTLLPGTLTQLEWVERCACTYDVDGVVFDDAHFPRHDDEYLAQLKKLAVDGGLTVAAYEVHGFFAPETGDDGRRGMIAAAAALGAPLLVCALPPPPEVPAAGYGEAVRAGKLALRAAKEANVTLALRNAPGTIGGAAADLRRYAKDADSAWLRFALDLEAAAPEDDGAMLRRAVIVYGNDLARLGAFRGFVCLAYAGNEPDAELPALLAQARRELFEGRQPHVPSAYPV